VAGDQLLLTNGNSDQVRKCRLILGRYRIFCSRPGQNTGSQTMDCGGITINWWRCVTPCVWLY